ncbi:bifunctional 4-hydroxy-2-oxoglutarate aldolase/2-dehydro-3-deoxy-phosphogluconate aldolase [Acinetobacter pollinis]|jgi:2-dehydro-3-deoxyphosphogluconate aldolase / (4S)-4-hydroxy-2-oxoglutarate aldolase|uniref:bifunctional 4-hydroxy-2-oxoglutarate aldolase/2-dehydro-3-deoxy-phosphogluconate aldolase n=1 Tax=Acinetobacter pollinis TaxID=2605270 RepID=UPI0018A2B675|nr:bifunctional 4-hydroxy-2-oxoglutarate aldolase/2-dehydro-3-deoxy-phosphogluconate aldolase [Acinetobacter pollinis]MBF7691382.1 bifunctional 4-hydroxy-2-oxoglutarate aldolase/2-dehydro-3-deoxy-phosphogluconate aldolase [Acinetobacter pollinis]MBF7693812.1 bifunctional 4-hydroxy-2-oxoglutarate aldolase/2-dehydro-3-deoxy-phosphogluconate aldolase [Acinetobacter pollinis]MBF7698428.1 bifunctional 4-hydroxy-2-oxoglutarate aldolase/2-dehydro-3-deoxy-phosphogluconate aldolase [Acinetobacter pollini
MIKIQDIVQLGPVIPVLAFDSAEQGEHVSRALHAGGVKVLEITLRTAAGLAAIERASHLADDIVVGVGTITKPEHCAQAKKAGAQFGVSPGLTRDLHLAAQDAGLPLLPGVMTPSDLIQAIELGYEIVKFFPAQQAGGTKMLQAFYGPFPNLSFCPTGGITPETAPDFLKQPNVVCVGGSWLTPKTALASQDWAEITRLAQIASQLHG